jgi:hypothetical protein
VNLTTRTVESNVRLGPFTHPNSDGDEIVAVEKALLAHPEVQAEIAKLKLPEGTVLVADPWIYGMCVMPFLFSLPSLPCSFFYRHLHRHLCRGRKERKKNG